MSVPASLRPTDRKLIVAGGAIAAMALIAEGGNATDALALIATVPDPMGRELAEEIIRHAVELVATAS